MQIGTSYEKLKRWSRRNYGIIALTASILGLALAFIQTNRLQNRAMILDYKLSVIEEKLARNETMERERIAYDATLQNDLREVKGYIRGVSDSNLRQMVEKVGTIR